MKVVLAENIGFCWGVKRAIKISEGVLKSSKKPVYFLGPLVHNEKVNQEIKEKGGRFTSNLSKIKSGTLIIRAHGISPDLENKIPKPILIKDSTCPLVKKAQESASKLFNQGYQVIIIGDKEHTETKAIKGHTENKAIIIENKKQAKNLPNFKKAGVVAQTTQNKSKVNEILKIIKAKSSQTKWLNTLCPEVNNRQTELKKMIKENDGILVVGSKTSANTTRLAEIAKNSKKPTWWINSPEQIKKEDFEEINSLGVVSGTSTPNWLIKKIVDKLRAL